MESISDLKKEIQRLREQNAQLHGSYEGVLHLFEKNPLPCLVIDQDSLCILNVNEAAILAYGYPREAFLRLSVLDLRPPEEVPKFLAFHGRPENRQGIYKGEWIHQTRDGTRLSVEITASNLEYQGHNARLVIIRDLTEKKEADEALVENEYRLRLALGVNRLGVYDWNIQTGQVIWDEAHARMFGLKLEEFGGRVESFQKFVHPQDVAQLDAGIQRSLLSSDLIRGVYRIFRPDGKLRWIEWLGQTIFEGNAPVRMVGVSRDITDERLARQKFQELDQFNTALIENTPAPIFAADREGRLIVCNRFWEKIVGMSRSDALGKRLEEIFPARDAERFHRTNQQVFDTGNPFHFEEEFETESARYYMHTNKFPVFDADGEVSAVAGICVDISDLRRLQEEQIKNSKLEAVGRLAGGIAHDFNNLLATILGNVSLTRQLIGTESPLDRRLVTVEKACRRAAGLTQQLLTFARGGSPVLTATSLPELIRDTVEFALVGTSIEAEFDFPDNLLDGNIDPTQIEQVFQNLTINARDAMSDNGRIKISARNTSIQDSIQLEPGEYIELNFLDTGCGIPENSLGNIFEPYFTTKQSGSGLGLAVVHSIISHHGGSVSVSSRLGEGTGFRIFLPASPRGESYRPFNTGGRVEQTMDFSGLHILVMDDESEIRVFLEDSLKEMGFQVTAAENGEAALEAFGEARKLGNRFHLGVFDMTVRGGMGGRETLQRIQQLDPPFRAIVASGYSNDDVVANYKKFGFRAALPKPFSMSDLHHAVLTVLGLNN